MHLQHGFCKASKALIRRRAKRGSKYQQLTTLGMYKLGFKRAASTAGAATLLEHTDQTFSPTTIFKCEEYLAANVQ
eukprot:11699761-Karenia_brevis.AAC.1